MSTKIITNRGLWESLLNKPPAYHDLRWQLYWTHAYWRTRGCLPGTSSAACPHRRSCSWHWAAAGVLQWPAGDWSPQLELWLASAVTSSALQDTRTHDCTLTIRCHLWTTTIRNINMNFNNNISPSQLNIIAGGEYPRASNMWVSLGVQSASHVWPWPWLYFEARSEASVWKMMQREVW